MSKITKNIKVGKASFLSFLILFFLLTNFSSKSEEVSKFSEIPMDFKGYMGVPVTFFNHHNPEQFEIIGCANSQGYDPEIVGIPQKVKGDGRANLHGKVKFGRIIIKNKRL